jgi:hypothetical protein
MSREFFGWIYIGYVHYRVGNLAAATSLNYAVLCNTGLDSEISKGENRKVDLLRA